MFVFFLKRSYDLQDVQCYLTKNLLQHIVKFHKMKGYNITSMTSRSEVSQWTLERPIHFVSMIKPECPLAKPKPDFCS